MISRQVEFNASTVRIISGTSLRCAELNQRQQELETAFSAFKLESVKTIADCITTVKDELDSKIELTTKELLTQMDGGIRTRTCAELNQRQQDLETAFSAFKLEFVKKIADCITTAKDELDSKIELTTKELFTQMDGDIHARTWLAHVLEDRIQKGLAQKSAPPGSTSEENTNYFLFEERFRGSRKDIKQRQLSFLPYFEKCSHVLDIGCGRGEFLEILREHNIGAKGVDLDTDMINYCISRQFDVEQGDAITYLEKLDDNSLDGIFIDQVVEHLEPAYLARMLALCYLKLKYGYYLIVETVNPLSFVSFVNFYIDMTHKRPVHPETLQYLLSASGFRLCERKFLSPVPDEQRLKKLTESSEVSESLRKNIELCNCNVDLLNSILFGAQDYAVIGKK
jgi:O-antigen chain-terminating methyltransferase